MRERNNERSLRESMERYGGKALKFTSPGNNGVPDRLVILPGGRIWFVELKTRKGRLSALQEWQGQQLEALGCQIRHVWGMDEANAFIREVQNAVSST